MSHSHWIYSATTIQKPDRKRDGIKSIHEALRRVHWLWFFFFNAWNFCQRNQPTNQQVFFYGFSAFGLSVFDRNMNSTDVASDFQTSCELSKNHQHLRNETRERLKNLFVNTPSLRDLSYDVTPEEIAAEIAIVNGVSIKVYVTREPYQQLMVIVSKNGTVRDLKAAIRRTFIAQRNRQRSNQQSDANDAPQSKPRNSGETIPNISWKYIWRTYYLQHGSDALVDDEKTLREYDVRNKTVLNFVKRIKIDRRMQRNKLSDKHK